MKKSRLFYNFTDRDWALLVSHPGFQLFLQFGPSSRDVERAAFEILDRDHGIECHTWTFSPSGLDKPACRSSLNWSACGRFETKVEE